jgi:hypothetical protein
MPRPFRGDSADLVKQEKRLRENMEREIASAAERCRKAYADTMKRLEDNRQAAALLSAEGFTVLTHSWWGEDGENLRVDLGDGVSPKGQKKCAAELLRIARALQCHFEESSEAIDDLHSKRRIVRAVLTPADFPGAAIVHTTRLPREKGKCRIVKQVTGGRRREVSYEVVCDARTGGTQ